MKISITFRLTYLIESTNQFTGSFSQMVWVESRLFGIGKARSRNGKIFVVAQYTPAGKISYIYQMSPIIK